MKDIRHLSEQEMNDFLADIGEKSFRKKQIEEWLWQKNVTSFDEMINLSKSLIAHLKENFTFRVAVIEDEVRSSDETTKYIFRFHDNCAVEGVLIPTKSRVTACISSQVGCPLKCAFCATGTMGLTRNLHFSEIIDQYSLMNRRSIESFGMPISNIVFMGMGEPLLNFDNVIHAINILISPKGNALSPSRITLSTVGIIDALYRLADLNFKPGLAISLHIPENEKRSMYMPVNRTNTLSELQKSLRYFHEKTGQRITIEYVLLNNINDSLKDAELLCRFCRAFPVKINLIEYNSTDSNFKKSDNQQVIQFKNYLEIRNLVVNIRHSRGTEVAAACGQLVKSKQEVKK